MKKRLIAGVCLWATPLLLAAQQVNYLDNLSDFIENTAVFELNQEEGRSYFIPEKQISLNGDWKFFYSDTPEGIPSDFFSREFDDGDWNSIRVPSNWEMQGYGDKLFRNVHAPFPTAFPDEVTNPMYSWMRGPAPLFAVLPPAVPKRYNPTGAYRKTFTVPASWQGEEVFLRLEKVASASFVWVNGQEVGYNEGAQEPAEYRITPYLKAGENTVAVHVVKYSDGYYLEGQDYWRLAGIFDDVWVYATPTVRLFDWQVITDLDATYTDASLELVVDIKKYGETPTSAYAVQAFLSDVQGEPVAELGCESFTLGGAGKQVVRLKQAIKQPRKWTSETPHLYTLKMQLLGADGKVLDQAQTRIGFKETEIRDGVFYLNGVPLKVNAQNSHMQHPDWGHVMTEEVIRKDFEILKRFNFNAVRTSHYPPVNRYLELADEYGLFVIDEAGVEAHATEYVSDLPAFTAMYRERVRRMVLRDRNHPCVLFWSAGNESGEGFNISEVVEEGKLYDPTRYWMYGGNAYAHPAEEIIGPRYPIPLEVDTRIGLSLTDSDRRPSFMDEYLSVAGNGGGGMDDYWRAIYAHPRSMGGAIWDFVSVGLTERVRLLTDRSPNGISAHLMGNARLVKNRDGNALDLNGHDQWVEVYRDDRIEIDGDQLTLSLAVYPRELVSSCGSFLTKGNYQFGIQQQGKDSLEFYLYTTKRESIRAALPADWELHWHQLTAVYDGQVMALYIDGVKKASGRANGQITNFPFPINIGRNAEVHGQETAVYICDALLDNVGIFTQALDPQNIAPEKAAFWLDFEKETDGGTFYSYGIGARTYGSIWPDRRVQPEMWQMKKSVQPIAIEWVDPESGWVEVWNRNHFLDASHYRTTWCLEADGERLQEGVLDLAVPPLTRKRVRIPFTKPAIVPGKEYRITVSSCLRDKEVWAEAGWEVAWDQLELPWRKASTESAASPGKVSLVQESDGLLVVRGSDFSYTFDKGKGCLVSIRQKDKELLQKPLRLNVWRAPLANEQDQWNSRSARSSNWRTGYWEQIATEYYSMGLDQLTAYPVSVEAFEEDGKAYVRVREITLTGISSMGNTDLYIFGVQHGGFESLSDYAIDGNGELTLHHQIYPQGQLPLWLPRIGLTMTLNKELDAVTWYGRGPQENYPDRKSGYKIGVYASTVQDMYEPYLLPQDYGLRTDNRWVRLTDKAGDGLEFRVNELFNFNAYPYSTENLTRAMYTYQLQEQDGITFNLDYATSGVGCTARGIFPGYRVYPQVWDREVRIRLVSE